MLKHQEITGDILNAFYTVYNALGHGFSERVYHIALQNELTSMGHKVESEKPIQVYYRGYPTASFFADLVVDDAVRIAMEAQKQLIEENEAQLLNYLRATRYEVGILLNFGPTAEHKRKAYDNERKGTMTWLEGSIK